MNFRNQPLKQLIQKQQIDERKQSAQERQIEEKTPAVHLFAVVGKSIHRAYKRKKLKLFSTFDFFLKVLMQSFFDVPVWKFMNSDKKWKMELDVTQSLVERTNNVEDTIKTQIWRHRSLWDVAESNGIKIWHNSLQFTSWRSSFRKS